MLQQFQQVGRVGSSQNHRSHHISALHHFRQMQFLPGSMRRVVEGEKNHVPSVRGAAGLRPLQDTRVESMEHCAIAKQKGESLSLVSLREIDIQLCCGLQYLLLNSGINAIISVKYAGGGSNADLGLRGDFAKSCFFLRCGLLHKRVDSNRLSGHWTSSTISIHAEKIF